MKRDLSLMRVLLAHVEEGTLKDFIDDCSEKPEWQEGQTVDAYNASDEKKQNTARVIHGHLWLLVEGGYVAGVTVGNDSERKLNCFPGKNVRLTNAGHDLLCTLRSKPVVDELKRFSKEQNIEVGLDALKTLMPIILKRTLEA